MRKISFLLLVFCVLHVTSAHSPAGTDAESRAAKGDLYMSENNIFLAIEEYTHAIEMGLHQAGLFRNLAVAYFRLGFTDDAISQMKRAVELSPEMDFLRMELGILYLAKGSVKEGKTQIFTILRRNPGYTNAYYYLGEAFLKERDYDMAWLSAKMAKRLGHAGNGLMRKLSAVSDMPEVVPWNTQDKKIYIRQMLFTTYEKAREVKRRLGEGELFEDIAIHEDESGNALSSGFLGRFDPSEVHPEIAKALLAREMLGEPAIVQTESGFHIVQRITPFDPGSWETLVTNKTVPRSEPRQFVKAGKKEEGNESPRKHNRQQKGRFIVHAGSFKDKHNATERDNSLRTLGYESYLVTKQSKANGVFYHVIAGKYDDMRDARSAGQAIASHGFDYFIFSEKKD